MLYYGVLSSPLNVDLLAEEHLQKLRRQAQVMRLHANELGNGGLVPLIKGLVAIQRRLDFKIDLYRVAKPDHAIICFFDQVFDHGNNPAITWSGYWTPLRYVLLLKLAKLFDEDLSKRAWEARIETDDAKAESLLVSVCADLRSRVRKLPDARSQQLISDVLTWAEKNPSEIYYNTKSKKERLQVTPNIVGFQSVIHGIASRLKRQRKKEAAIIVDQQSQFNKAQKTLSEYFAAMSGISAVNAPGLPAIDFSGMPKTPITFSSSASSGGLELVDVHLWVFKRVMEKKYIAPELYALVKPHIHRGNTNEISLNALAARWERWFGELPDPTEEQIAEGKKLMEIDEERRLHAFRGGDKPIITSDLREKLGRPLS